MDELNQPFKREVLGKMTEPTESDNLTESITEESAEESPVMRDQLVKRAMEGLRKYKFMARKLERRVNDNVTNPKVVKTKAAAVVTSLTGKFRPVRPALR